MSNPGVIILDNTSMTGKEINGPRLQIEDNIGEAIHIHLGDLRLDFTISDFLIFEEGIKRALNNLLNDAGINLDLIDPPFLRELEDHLRHMIGYHIKNIELDKLKCIEYNQKKLLSSKSCKIINTLEFKYLNNENEKGTSKESIKYDISEYREDTINELRRSIETNGYPFNNKYIVLLGDELVIRDGKKRAVLLRHLYGNIEIPIMILNFKKKYKKYRCTRQININDFLKYYLKLIIPLKMRNPLKKLIRRICFFRFW